MIRIRLSVCLAAIALAWSALGAQAPAPQAPPPPETPRPAAQTSQDQPPVFRTGVEVLPLDVTVLDRDGLQVKDLTAADFTVEVDGQVRRIVTAEYVRLADEMTASMMRNATAPAAAAPSGLDGVITSNGGTGAAPGRAILLMIDQGNIRFGAARPVMQTALKFIDRLQPNDRIGVVAVPGPGEVQDFTTDHAKVREAMLRITGQVAPAHRSFNISMTEAFAIYRQNDAMLANQVFLRECSGAIGAADQERCERDVEQEAAEIVGDIRTQTDRSVSAMRAVLKSLGAMEGPKSVILISEGLVLEGLGGEINDLANVAAEVRASLDVLLLEVARYDASQSQMPTTAQADRTLQEEGLLLIAGMSRGNLHRIVSSADNAFQKIERSLAGYYLLGVEPGTNDRDGKRHRIEVKTTRKGVTLQARRMFLSSEGPPPATPEEALKRTLRSASPANGLPMRLSTWTYKEPGSSRVKMVIATEVARGTTQSLDYQTGLVVATKEGKVIAGTTELKTLAVHDADATVATYMSAVTLDPGVYRIRVALADEDKRVGSVEREVQAWQMNGDELTLGDLLIAPEPPPGGAVGPAVEPRVQNGTLVALAEAYVPAASQQAAVAAKLEVMRDESSRVLVSQPLQVLNGTAAEVRVAQGRVSVGAVPPGNYIARVSFTENGTARGALVRPFRVLALKTGAGVSVAGAGAPGELLAAVLGSLPAVSKDDVLTADTTAALWTAAEQGRSPQVLAAIKTARGGQMLDGALAALSAGDQSAAAFVRGMDYLGKGQLDQAATQFRNAMVLQNDFAAARAMLGVCLLVANHEKEAAGLLMSVPATSIPAFGRLAGEAWLKAGQPTAAVTPLEQAPPSDARAKRALALAYALTGDGDKSLPMLKTYLDGPGAKDAPALAAGVYATYRRHASGTDATTIAADKVQARTWARAYLTTKGPLSPLVEAWASYLETAK